MFGQKKNIADEMALAYNAIQKETDAGVKLLRLEKLEVDIKGLLTAPLCKETDYDAGSTLGTTAQVATVLGTIIAPVVGGSAMIVNSLSEAGHFGLFAGGIATIVVGTGVGSSIYDSVHKGIKSGIKNFVHGRKDNKSRKKHIKQQANYTKNIAPYTVNLREIVTAISEDKATILSAENVMQLRMSSQLEKVLKSHPELMDSFNKYTGPAPQSVQLDRPSKPGQDKNLSL